MTIRLALALTAAAIAGAIAATVLFGLALTANDDAYPIR